MLCICIALTGCSSPDSHDSDSGADSSVQTAQADGTRDATAQVLVPQADGIVTYGSDIVSVDASHTSDGYVNALRASLRQSPDVILLGEMRDYETMDVAMTAAETGHLVFSTLHTIGAANTIDRIIDVFPANQQRQIAVQLSMVLQAVISQQLVPALDGTQVPAFEIMTVTPAIRNMIRDNKIPQIDGTVYSANKEDMHSMDYSLQLLVKEGTVAPETALSYASNPEMLKKKL